MKEIGVKDDLKDFWLEHLDGVMRGRVQMEQELVGGGRLERLELSFGHACWASKWNCHVGGRCVIWR